mgnify:CR=1 FL=1
MSAALAPEYDVTTKIVFSPMSGNKLVDNLVRENTPKIATVTKISATVTGLFTDVLYKLMFYDYFTMSTLMLFLSLV